MEQWDFDAWLAALGALGPQRAAMLGLAAAQRISGCLNDERFYRYGLLYPSEVDALLEGCWELLTPREPGAGRGVDGAGDGSGAGDTTAGAEERARREQAAREQAVREETVRETTVREARVSALAQIVERISKASEEYVDRSMTDLFHAYGPLVDEYAEYVHDGGETARGDMDQALRDFVEEAEPGGAVAAHLDALNAVEFAAQACTGGPWDGALRCIQTTAMAGQFARGAAEGPDSEIYAQEEDLAALTAVNAADGPGLRAVAEQLRARARLDAAAWHAFTVKLELYND